MTMARSERFSLVPLRRLFLMLALLPMITTAQAQAQSKAIPSSVTEFAVSGPLGDWRFPDGRCDTPPGERKSPLILSEASLSFSVIRCEIIAYEQIGAVWRLSATCTPNDGGSNAKFVLAPLDEQRLIMALLTANETHNYMLHHCEGLAAK